MGGCYRLSLIGLANILGSLLFGRLGDRHRKKYLLSALYFGRSVVISLFLVVPLTNVTALLFCAFIGIF